MGLTIDKCIEGWTNSLKQLRLKADIVFYGDSLTYYGDFASVFPDKVVCNLGLRGDTIQGMINRIEQVCIMQPDKVYLMAGINDVTYCSLKTFEELYEMLITHMLLKLPTTSIVIQSILPVDDTDFTISCTSRQIMDCNAAIASLAQKYQLDFLDLFSVYAIRGKLPRKMTSDGIHLQYSAYSKWLDLLKAYIHYGRK